LPYRRRLEIATSQTIILLGQLVTRIETRKHEVEKAIGAWPHFFGLCWGRCGCKRLAFEFDALSIMLAKTTLVYDSFELAPTFESVRFARRALRYVKNLDVPELSQSKLQNEGRARALAGLLCKKEFTVAQLKMLSDNLDFIQGRLPRRRPTSTRRPSPLLTPRRSL
jgi:hypothetical protein